MGVLDEVPNLGNQAQTWANFWQNQNKWTSEREAGEAASTGNWDEAQRRALARGNVDLYKDYHNIQQVTQNELGQKILATVQAAKTPQQYHAIIDTMTQHGVPGLSKYRIPPGGDFDTTRNAALAELGQYNEYLKYQQEQQKLETERRKATYLGTMTVPGAPAVSRETGPMNLPKQEVGYLPYSGNATAGVSAGQPQGATAANAAAPEPSMSLADVSAKLHSEMGSRGLGEAAKPPMATTPAGKEKKFLVSTLATGEPVYHELPEGAEFEGKGTKAKPNLEMQIFESLKADAIEKGTYTNDEAIWSKVAQHVQTTKQKESAGIQEMKFMAANPQQAAVVEKYYAAKKGPEKHSPIERAAVRLQAEAEAQGTPLGYGDALDIARKSIKGEGPAMARLNAIMGPRGAEYIDAIRQEHVAQGKEPEAMQLAHAMQQEAIDAGQTPPSIEDSYRKSIDLGGKRASDVQLMQYLANRNPGASKEQLDKEFNDLKTRLTAVDREREAIKSEAGVSTEEAIKRQTKAKTKTQDDIALRDEFMASAERAGHPITEAQAMTMVEAHRRAVKPESADMQIMKYASESPEKAKQVENFFAKKKGAEKQSAQERNVIHVQAEAEAAGKPISYLDALKIVQNASKNPSAAVQELQMIMGPDHDRVIKAINERAAAEGKIKQEPEAIRMAHDVMEESKAAGAPMTLAEAYSKVKGHDVKPSADMQLFEYFKDNNPSKNPDEITKMVKDFKTQTTATERELAAIKTETGKDTLGAIGEREKAKAKAVAEGRAVPQVFTAKQKDASGKEVEGTLFVNPVTKQETFIPHPEGVSDVSKFAARNNKMNAELDEIEKIRKERGVDELEAIRLRTEAKSATKNPSAELQGINALRTVYPKEDVEQLTKRWLTLHEKKTDYDKKLAAIMDAHPGETKEDAMLRAAAINKLTVLKADPAAGAFKAVPIEGTIDQQKLNKPLSNRESDLRLLSNAYAKDERFKDMPEVDRIAMARGVLNQKGYNVHIDDSGNAVYQIADNSKAQMDQTRTLVAKEMADIRKRVATEPQLRFQMAFADAAAKNDVKTMGREAQTVVVDNHIKGVESLAGGLEPKTQDDLAKRRALNGAIGLITSNIGLNRIKEMANKGSTEAIAARSLISYKMALQSETARLLSMGMTGNIAHEHAKELGQIVGDLDKIPSVDALLKQLHTLKEITSAIRTLPMIPGDPIEAQRMINERDSMTKADHGTAKKWADEISGPGSTGTFTAKDGRTHKFQKTLNPTGTGVTVIDLGVQE